MARHAAAAPPAAPLDLSGYNDADLLTTAYALTHSIHVVEERAQTSRANPHTVAADLRAQRDLITAEALRRMGGR